MNHMTTCLRTSRMQATSHTPRLTEVKRACVLRDVRDSQGAPSPSLLFWRSSHSDDWPLQLSASLAANSWSAARDLCVSAASFLRLSTSAARFPLLGQFCLDRCCQSGNFLLLRCNESRLVGIAVLFLLLGGHQLLQNANDLAALWCVPLTGTARRERKQRGTIIIGNPVRRAFEPTATSTESNTSGDLAKGIMITPAFYPRLL